jgi:hypothetical protein
VPGVADFCRATACCIFFVFLLQSTFFAGLMVFDQRRMEANRIDCCPCCCTAAVNAADADADTDGHEDKQVGGDDDEQGGRTAEETVTNEEAKELVARQLDAEQDGKPGSGGGDSGGGESVVRRFIRTVYAPILLHPVVKAAVLLRARPFASARTLVLTCLVINCGCYWPTCLASHQILKVSKGLDCTGAPRCCWCFSPPQPRPCSGSAISRRASA